MSTVPTGEVIEKAVLLAGCAPSLHNSQPWRWVFDGTSLQLFSVRERMLPATDTTGRQLILSCGIALDHLRVAMAADGWRCHIALRPDPNRHDHLATVRFSAATIVTDADRERADAIMVRHTDRLAFDPPAHWDDVEPVLRGCFDPADADLDVLPDSSRAELARASALTASMRRYDSGYQSELRWWTGHSIASMGVPETSLVTTEERAHVAVGRMLPTASGEDRRPGMGADRSTILLLSTDEDTPVLVRVGSVPAGESETDPTPRLPSDKILQTTDPWTRT